MNSMALNYGKLGRLELLILARVLQLVLVTFAKSLAIAMRPTAIFSENLRDDISSQQERMSNCNS